MRCHASCQAFSGGSGRGPNRSPRWTPLSRTPAAAPVTSTAAALSEGLGNAGSDCAQPKGGQQSREMGRAGRRPQSVSSGRVRGWSAPPNGVNKNWAREESLVAASLLAERAFGRIAQAAPMKAANVFWVDGGRHGPLTLIWIGPSIQSAGMGCRRICPIMGLPVRRLAQ